MNPGKVCSQLGLCDFNGVKEREAGIASVLDKDEYVSSSGERNNPARSLTVLSMPTVSFTIAGKRFELTPEEVSYLFLPSWPHSATPSPT
ncbi:unnamed protein product [Sphagnum troendelagicum]